MNSTGFRMLVEAAEELLSEMDAAGSESDPDVARTFRMFEFDRLRDVLRCIRRQVPISSPFALGPCPECRGWEAHDLGCPLQVRARDLEHRTGIPAEVVELDQREAAAWKEQAAESQRILQVRKEVAEAAAQRLRGR